MNLLVEGAPPVNQTQAVPCSTPFRSVPQLSLSTNHPMYSQFLSAKKEPTASVKVVQAQFTRSSSGKVEFP